jgi:hypothetical protein
MMVVGNGFTIDCLTHLNMLDEIDVSNLFRFGSCVPWPADGEPGFLSYKRCPHLWNLGARPNMPLTEAMALIESIITCVNVFVSAPQNVRSRTPRSRDGRPNDLYIFAYKELALYLKHLFVYYDNKVKDLPDKAVQWPWARFLKRVHESDAYNRVTIIDYNYDVWLERILRAADVPFIVAEIEPEVTAAKIRILKPHGSISFAHKTVRDRQAFAISPSYELLDGSASDFTVRYDRLSENYLVNALIPPAGESGRFNHTWAGQIRSAAKAQARVLGTEDELLLCGLSYWHVDRPELDELLTSCDPTTNVKMINPQPLRSMDAVLTSIFDNYISYTSTTVLEALVP